MPQYYVEVRVDFSGYLEAENAEDAEQKAFTAWGEELSYDGVYSVEVEEEEEACMHCEGKGTDIHDNECDYCDGTGESNA